MSPDAIFSLANTAALATWIVLALFPRRAWAQTLAGTVVPLGLAATYAAIAAIHIGRGPGDFNSLPGVAALFANPWLLLAGWIHYLAFDLLVGTWEARDAAARGLSRWWLTPCLLLTFMLGPAGWLLYQGVRATRAPAKG